MILESREVTKKYGSKTAVNQVSLQLEPGLVYAMLGPNLSLIHISEPTRP